MFNWMAGVGTIGLHYCLRYPPASEVWFGAGIDLVRFALFCSSLVCLCLVGFSLVCFWFALLYIGLVQFCRDRWRQESNLKNLNSEVACTGKFKTPNRRCVHNSDCNQCNCAKHARYFTSYFMLINLTPSETVS